jgi:protein-S-isoprenylcysteine O-methyltransferase Ste14
MTVIRRRISSLQMRPAERAPESLPSLGRRGQGWLYIQQLLIIAVVGCCIAGPRWPGAVRMPLHVIGVAGLALGAAMLIASFLALGESFRTLPEPLPGAALKQGHLYGLVRHPIYGAIIVLGFAGSAAYSPLALLPAAALVPVLVGKSMVEERWLADAHPEYAAYRRRVRRRFLPGIF